MKAAVLEDVGRPFAVAEVDVDGPRSGEVLVKIAASGLCASDLNAIDGKRTLVPFPAVLGHEASGVVVETGDGVSSVEPGDHVVLSIVPHCGQCAFCLAGRPNFCVVAGDAMFGGNLFDGTSRLSRGGERLNHFLTVSSFAEFAVVPESGLVRIPQEMPLDAAALISCAVLTGFGATHNTVQVTPGSRVAVIGCGGVGLNVIQGARLAGAARIVAVDVSDEKFALAAKVGATDVVDARASDPVAEIRRLVGGVDFAFEALGREETIRQAFESLDAGGKAVLVGLMKKDSTLTLPSGPFVNEVSIHGCYFGTSDLQRDVPALVDKYLSGDLLLDEIISRRISLDGLNEAVDQLRNGEGARSVLVFE